MEVTDEAIWGDWYFTLLLPCLYPKVLLLHKPSRLKLQSRRFCGRLRRFYYDRIGRC